MHHAYKEVLFALFFLTSIGVSFEFGIYVLQTTQLSLSPVAEAVVDVCQVALSNSWGVIRQFVSFSFVLVCSAILLKALLSVIKNRQIWNNIQTSKLHDLPSPVLKILKQHNLASEQLVCIDSADTTACTIGFFKPKIIISASLVRILSYKELEAVILHEYHHANRYHPLLLVLASIIGKSLIFFPALADLANYMRQQLEQDADRTAIRAQGTNKYVIRALQNKDLHREFLSISWQESWHAQFARINPDQLLQRINTLRAIQPPTNISKPILLRIVLSLISLCMILAVWLLPSQVSAVSNTIDQLDDQHCDPSACYTNCVLQTPLFSTTVGSMSSNSQNMSLEKK